MFTVLALLALRALLMDAVCSGTPACILCFVSVYVLRRAPFCISAPSTPARQPSSTHAACVFLWRGCIRLACRLHLLPCVQLDMLLCPCRCLLWCDAMTYHQIACIARSNVHSMMLMSSLDLGSCLVYCCACCFSASDIFSHLPNTSTSVASSVTQAFDYCLLCVVKIRIMLIRLLRLLFFMMRYVLRWLSHMIQRLRSVFLSMAHICHPRGVFMPPVRIRCSLSFM